MDEKPQNPRDTIEKPFQFSLKALLLAMLCFSAALGVGMFAYRANHPGYWPITSLAYALGGAGIGALDRKALAGAACGLLVWIGLPLLSILLR